jgi:hypothetical protein
MFSISLTLRCGPDFGKGVELGVIRLGALEVDHGF